MYEIFEKILDEKGLRTADVVKATGIGASSFSDWKKGRLPRIDKLLKIAVFLNVSIDYLLGRKENPPADVPELTEDEIEMLRLYRQASQLAKMQAFSILSESADDKKSNVLNA